MRDCAVVILAAGLGTRMKSEKAKVLHELAGLPMVCYPVKTAVKLKLSPVVVVVGHQGKLVEKILREFLPKADLRFVTQKQQLGTGHAVKTAKKALKGFTGDILVLYGDVPLLSTETIQAFRRAHEKAKTVASVLTIVLDDPKGYGRIIRDEKGYLKQIIEERDATGPIKKIQEVNSGIWLADKAALFPALEMVDADNDQKEYYLTDAVEIIAKGKCKVKGAVGALGASDPYELVGINSRNDLAMINGMLREMINEYWMKQGVTMEDPYSTYVDSEVIIEPDTILGPGVYLKGNTRIGNGCIIETGAHITDCHLAPGVHVKPYSVMEGAEVDTGTEVGPFARLRPGTKIGPENRVGNFVEMKKVTTGKGTKVSHLTYLGDAKLGSDINVGAGTITCNYDGVNKFMTIVEDGVFIGSDSQLVAPVTVGKGAYIGSGSTITKDVPAGALAVARGRQMTKNGYAKKYTKDKKKK